MPINLQGIMSGLGQKLYGPAPSGVDPALAEQQRQRAMLMLGLGMMAGKGSGKTFGESALMGMGLGSQAYDVAMQRAYESAEKKRLEEREDIYRKQSWDIEDQREARREAAAAARQAQADEAAGERTRISTRSKPEDEALARQREVEADATERREKIIAELEEKLRTGTATPQDRQTYELLRRGYIGSGLGMIGGGYGGGSPSIGNPLLNDPEL